MTYTIHETCSCGAVFDYSETINKPTESALKEEHERFLKAHQKCQKYFNRDALEKICANGPPKECDSDALRAIASKYKNQTIE